MQGNCAEKKRGDLLPHWGEKKKKKEEEENREIHRKVRQDHRGRRAATTASENRVVNLQKATIRVKAACPAGKGVQKKADEHISLSRGQRKRIRQAYSRSNKEKKICFEGNWTAGKAEAIRN